MKNSRIKWIGQIPEDWDMVPNRYLFIDHSTKVGEQSYKYQLLSLTTMGVKEKDINASGGKVPETYDNYQTVEPGDMIFCLFDLDCSAVFSGLSNYFGMITSAYDVLKPNYIYLDNLYADFWFQYVFSNRYYKIYSKNIRYTITTDMFKSIKTPIPPIETQRKIGKFLYEKHKKIEDLIANQQAQIEKLKEYKQAIITEAVTKGLNPDVSMKDSGVEWIGQIPISTTLTKLKYVGKFLKGPFGSAVKKSMFVEKNINTYKVYEQKNVIYQNIALGDYYITESDYNALSAFAIQEGDILVSCAGTIGAIYIVPKKFECGIINQALMRIRLYKSIDKKYFVYLFLSLMEKEASKFSNGSAMKNIPPFDSMKNFYVPQPTLKEQQQIADYLDKKCADIDSLISIKQQKIEELKEYKKSLIYEYVTGKKEVA